MAIISKDNKKVKKFHVSIYAAVSIVYFLMMAFVFIILNTYPIFLSRDMVFAAKETSLLGQASVISSTLSSLDRLSAGNIEQVMKMIESDNIALIAVADENGAVIYKENREEIYKDKYDEYLNFKTMSYALQYKDVFISRFESGSFLSYAAVPLTDFEQVLGAVLIFEVDAEQGIMVRNLQRDMLRVSIVILSIVTLLCMVAMLFMSREIYLYLDALKGIREGDYAKKLTPGYILEFAKISEEINFLAETISRNEEIRRRFVSDASHELKTPLTSIKLLSDSISQSNNMDAETMRDFVGDIGKEAERLSRITEKLLSLTRIDNKVKINKMSVNLSYIIEQVLKILTPVAESNNITFVCNIDKSCAVLATEDDIYQIALNLMENAVKYNNPNGTVTVTVRRADESVELIVEDTGIGIPEDAIPFLFDRFYRVDKARSRAAGGSGLGLSIVKSTVEEHGGTVRAEPRDNCGTRFVVVFKSC